MPAPTPQTDDDARSVLLSPVESLFWTAGERFGGARIVVVLRLDGCVEADRLSAALRQLQRRHPKLRAAIARGSDGRNRYEFDRPVPLIPFEITDCGAEPPWRDEARRLLQTGFPAVGPLAAVAVLRNREHRRSELLLVVHHAIADGQSAIMLVHDLLTSYASAEIDSDEPACPPLPVVSAARTTSSAGWRRRVWMVRRIVRLQREDRRSRQTALPHASDIPAQSQWMHWVFAREDTLRLLRRCRREQTSLGGVQLAAVCCALMDCLAVSTARFKCQVPFDVRAALGAPSAPVTAEDLGCFVSTMNEHYDLAEPPAFWDLARRAHQNLQEFVHHAGPALYYDLARATMGRFGRVQTVRPGNTRVTLLATNYGVLNLRATYGELRPRECTLSFKNDVLGPSLIMEALVLGQQLNIGLIGEALEPAFWERLQKAVRNYLDDAASPVESAVAE